MKNTIFIILLIIISPIIFAQTYTINNNDIKISVTINDKSPIISSITDMKTGQEFISTKKSDSNFWTVTLKHNGKFEEMPGYIITPKDAEKIDVKQNKTSLLINFYNVRTLEMEEGFNITCSILLKKNNSYWDITVNPGKIYGIWEVSYPFINTLDTQNGDCFMIPAQGDVFVTEFDNPKGFPNPAKQNLVSYTKNYTYGFPSRMEYSSLTKGNSTLYMCPEDNTVMFKTTSFTTDTQNTINVYPTYFPSNMGIAGEKFTLPHPYNIAILQGNWFDAAKKYRKWGIENHYAPFAKGKMENRKDLPTWWKDLSWCVRTSIDHSYYKPENVINTIKNFNIPPLVHLYSWSIYRHDTNYPNWLPMNEKAKEFLSQLKDLNAYVMPYTNGHLVDINNSEIYKKNGDIMLKLRHDGIFHHESWAKEFGADNVQACTSSPYYDLYLNEVKNIFKLYPFDALYMDQVGVSQPVLCFDKRHTHAPGGGNFIEQDYNRLINDIKDSAREITGKEIPVTTEDGGDAFWFDGWLKCNEGGGKSHNNPVRSVVYSGYEINFGDAYFDEEYDTNNGLTVANKIASELTKGYVIGWDGFESDKLQNNRVLMNYIKDTVLARHTAKEYFNLGEMVREVRITSEIPKISLSWQSYFGTMESDFETIKTCSYSYKGKSMVCFTNAYQKSALISWNTFPKDLYLPQKKSYKISEIYPEKREIKSSANIDYTFTIKPFSNVIYVIE